MCLTVLIHLLKDSILQLIPPTSTSHHRRSPEWTLSGKNGNDPKVCACARNICLKQVGNADAGPKWNWIPGINACFNR